MKLCFKPCPFDEMLSRRTSIMKSLHLAATILSLAILSHVSVHAANTFTGNGGTSTTWAIDANWNKLTYPGYASATDNDARISSLVVDLGSSIDFALGDQTSPQLLMSSTGQLNINAGGILDMDSHPLIVNDTATLNQVDGNVIADGSVIVGQGNNSGAKNYNLSGGTATIATLEIADANSSAGTMTISGTGTLNVGTALNLAGGTNSSGTLNVSGGTVNLTGTAAMTIGAVGSGNTLFHQSGGEFNNASGQTVTLSGVNGGQGEFRLSGGVFKANGGDFDNSKTIGSQGTFAMSGGDLNMGGGNLKVSRGNSNDATNGQVFSITGGTVTGVDELWGGAQFAVRLGFGRRFRP
jgi:hypothetical protein